MSARFASAKLRKAEKLQWRNAVRAELERLGATLRDIRETGDMEWTLATPHGGTLRVCVRAELWRGGVPWLACQFEDAQGAAVVLGQSWGSAQGVTLPSGKCNHYADSAYVSVAIAASLQHLRRLTPKETP